MVDPALFLDENSSLQKPLEKKNAYEVRNKKRKIKRITETYLYNAGLYYLQRFVSSRHNFQRVMLKKIKRSCDHYDDQNIDICKDILEKVTQKFEYAGLLNDKAYAKGLAESLHRRGKSKTAIIAKLKSKGISQEIIQTIFDDHSPEQELNAAMTFARKKRIGPYAKLGSQKKTVKNAEKRKNLSKFARAGFSYSIAKEILEKKADKNG